jgi:hypothetical protein
LIFSLLQSLFSCLSVFMDGSDNSPIVLVTFKSELTDKTSRSIHRPDLWIILRSLGEVPSFFLFNVKHMAGARGSVLG